MRRLDAADPAEICRPCARPPGHKVRLTGQAPLERQSTPVALPPLRVPALGPRAKAILSPEGRLFSFILTRRVSEDSSAALADASGWCNVSRIFFFSNQTISRRLSSSH